MQIPPLSAADQQLQEQLLSERLLTPAQIKQTLSAREKAWLNAIDGISGTLCTLTPGQLRLSHFPSGEVLGEVELSHQPHDWGEQLAFVDAEDGRLLQTVPAPTDAGVLIGEAGSFWFSASQDLPFLGETRLVQGFGQVDSDLIVSPRGDLLFVTERHNGRLHVVSLVTHKLLTTLQIRESGYPSAICLTVAPDGRRAFITDQISSRLWILDLGTWKLSPLQTGLGTLGALSLTPDGAFLFLAIVEPELRLLYFDMQTLSVLQELELKNAISALASGAPADLLCPTPDYKRLLLLSAAKDHPGPQVHVIRPRQIRTLRRYGLTGNRPPVALAVGYENPLAELRGKGLGEWLVELGMLKAETLVRFRQGGSLPEEIEAGAHHTYTVPDPDDDPLELIQRAAPPISLPPEAEEVIVDSLVRAYHQETQKNLQEHPAEIQKLYDAAGEWRQGLEAHYAVQAQPQRLPGLANLPVLLTRDTLLQELDKRLEGRELPWKPGHRCPMCHAGLRLPRSCSQCGFLLEDPEGYQRREALSAEGTDELIPGQLLLALPQSNQLLLLNAWHEVIHEFSLKELGLKEPFHALALPNRHYLVCDRVGARVVELSPGGEIVRELPHPFTEPVMSTFYTNQQGEVRLLVVDRGSHEVLEFDSENELRCSWGSATGLELKQPRDVQRTWDDTLVITDTGNKRIVEVDRAGRVLSNWGPPQVPLVKPVLARREVNGDTLIVDAGRGQIIAFNQARQLVRNFRYWPPPELKDKLLDEPAPARFLVQQRDLLALSSKYWMQIAVPLQTIRWIKPWTGQHRSQRVLRLAATAEAEGSLALLRSIPFLKTADAKTLEMLESHLRPVSFAAGEMIVHQGELGSNMYFLTEGAVEVLKEGNDKPVAVLGPGNLFGEMALILSEPRIASVRAKSACSLLELDRRDFSQVVAEFPELNEHLRKLARERKALTHGFNHQKQQDLMRKVKARMAMTKLQELPFFKQVEEPLLETLADAMRPVAFMPRHTIFAQGESGEIMYFITRGQVEVSLGDSQEPIAVLGAGDILGEMALLLDQPRSATVRAGNYCQCFELDRQVFDHIAGQYPAFQERLRQLAAERLSLNQAYEEHQRASREAAAAMDAAHAAVAAEFDAALAGAEVIGSSPPMVCYLLSPRSEQLTALDGEGHILWQTGAELGLFRPYRLHTDNGTGWIVDSGNDRILALDLETRQPLREVGNHLLPLMQPRSAVPTPQGNLLIADEGNQRLVLAGPQGNYLWEYAAPHDILSPFYAEQTPVGTMLFCDAALHMVFEIEPRSQEVIWSYGAMLIAGDGPSELNEPCCVRRLANGSTLIADTGNHRLLLISPKGQLLKIFTGSERIPLYFPIHCDMLPNGEVLVWSRDEDEIIRLDLAGQPAWRARLPQLMYI